MSRRVLQLCAFLLRVVWAAGGRASPPPPAPPRPTSSPRRPPPRRLRTLRAVAEELGQPLPVVARVARELGYQDLVLDNAQAAAITAALQGPPPPRAA